MGAALALDEEGLLIVYALTVWQPWAWAIVSGQKDVENRSWRPTDAFIGERIGIHAGKHRGTKLERLAIQNSLATLIGREAIPTELEFGAMIGSVAIDGFTQSSDSPWASEHPGTWHWELSDPQPIAPVPCNGRQGLWQISLDVNQQTGWNRF